MLVRLVGILCWLSFFGLLIAGVFGVEMNTARASFLAVLSFFVGFFMLVLDYGETKAQPKTGRKS